VADVEDAVARLDVRQPAGGLLAARHELAPDHRVHRQQHLPAVGVSQGQDLAGGPGQVPLADRLPDLATLCEQEGVGHAAADGQAVQPGHQVLQQVDLGRDLGAADDTHHRPRRVAQRPVQVLQLRLHGQAGIGGQAPRHALGGGVGPVGGGEGVVDIEVAEARQPPHERRVVRLFARVVAQVLQQNHPAVGQGGHVGLGLGADAVSGEGHRHLQQLRQGLDDGRQAHPRDTLALGPVEMGDQHHLGAALAQIADGRRGRPQPAVVGHPASGHRHVEVDAHQDAPAAEVAGLVEGPERHRSGLRLDVRRRELL
jgi:hypothetical protein